MTGAKTCHQHQMYRYIIVCPTKYGRCDYMNPSRRQAIQQPTASVRQQIATGVIAELISLQIGHDGRRLAWCVKGEFKNSKPSFSTNLRPISIQQSILLTRDQCSHFEYRYSQNEHILNKLVIRMCKISVFVGCCMTSIPNHLSSPI